MIYDDDETAHSSDPDPDDAPRQRRRHDPHPEDPEPMLPREADRAADRYFGHCGEQSDRRAR